MKRKVVRRKLKVKRVVIAVSILVLFLGSIIFCISKYFFNDNKSNKCEVKEEIDVDGLIQKIVSYSSNEIDEFGMNQSM